MVLTIMLLEDDENVAETVREKVSAAGHNVVVVAEPARWANSVVETPCDMIVTDLRQDDSDDEDGMPGEAAVDRIFSQRFVPLVVHSGVADLVDRFPRYGSHPLLRIVPKALDSVDSVATKLTEFVEIATELRNVRDSFAQSLHETLTKTVEHLAAAEPEDWRSTLPHVVRRRVAATFDEPEAGRDKIRAVERYLIPPIATSLLTGDILIESSSEKSPEHTRLVLSQSCDLAWSETRVPQVLRVLVARPAQIAALNRRVRKAAPEDNGPVSAKQKELFRGIAAGNFDSGFVFLPKVPGVISGPLAFDLKDLEFLNIATIEHGSRDSVAPFAWQRVASQDSPFREQIVWALHAQLGRPALPEIESEEIGDQVAAGFQARARSA